MVDRASRLALALSCALGVTACGDDADTSAAGTGTGGGATTSSVPSATASSSSSPDTSSSGGEGGDGLTATTGTTGEGGGGAAATVLDTDYAADDDPDLPNPERGIYYWSPSEDDPHTLVAEWLYLGEVCAEELAWAGHGDPGTSPVLDAYADALVAHREAGRKVIFRPRYDTSESGGDLNGCGVFQAEDVELMRGHVDAIAPMLAEHADVIAFVEAGYLGRWGEWNHAEHDASTAPVLVDPAARRDFLAYVVDAYAAAGLDRFVELRRPLFARELIDAEGPSAVGLYNDCFMTNEADYGTYSNFEDDNPSNFASAAEAKAWAVELTATAPFGGETCPTGDEDERWRDCANMVGDSSEPGSLHMSYLHGGYALDARATWEAGGCYDEIRRRLGYRFEVEAVQYPPSVAVEQSAEIGVTIRNSGWSRLHNPRRAYLVLRSDAETFVVGGPLQGQVELPGTIDGAEVQTWEPGTMTELTAAIPSLPAGTWSLGVILPDADRPDVLGYAVAIASLREGAPVFEAASGVNDLGVTIEVAP
jgi:hypothetical protein